MHQDIEKLFSVKDKVAVITGGARHLGYDIAATLAAGGAHVIVTSRVKKRAIEASKTLTDIYAIESMGLELDHTNGTDVIKKFSNIMLWKNRIDILVNNAGGGSGKGHTRFMNRSTKDIDQLLKLNLNGMLYCTRAVAPYMARQKYGKIINIASVAGIIGRDRRLYDNCEMDGQAIEYAAAKAGVIGATLDLAAYLSPIGICVNAISPGGFNGKDRKLSEKFIKHYSERVPLGRMGLDGSDIKGVVLFLSSSASDYMTGQNLVLDGGFSIWN